jgi:hypothetical protein
VTHMPHIPCALHISLALWRYCTSSYTRPGSWERLGFRGPKGERRSCNLLSRRFESSGHSIRSTSKLSRLPSSISVTRDCNATRATAVVDAQALTLNIKERAQRLEAIRAWLFRGEPWQNGHFGAEMQPVAVAPAPN